MQETVETFRFCLRIEIPVLGLPFVQRPRRRADYILRQNSPPHRHLLGSFDSKSLTMDKI
jgi:hypothetical protein